MSLVAFSARNHPQQRALDSVNDRATTPEIFDPLHAEFEFTVDVAAAAHNAKLPRYYTRSDDGLAQDWTDETVWCNPPYSSIRPWVAKAWRSDCTTVMLLPANRTEQRWWQDLVEPYRDRGLGFTVRFLPGRIRFIAPGHTLIGPDERPPFGCCLLIWQGHAPAELDPQTSLDFGGAA